MSAAALYLVDAHNLIHQDPHLRRLVAKPEAARAALEKLLDGQVHILLFYDGGPGGKTQTVFRRGLRIDYSGKLEADERIVEWLRDHPGLRATVVTDDRALRGRAKALGGKLASARDFLDRFKARSQRMESKPDAPSDPEVKMWLEIFKDAEAES